MPQTKPLKISDIIRFLEAKGAKARCVACGSKHFETVDEFEPGARVALKAFKFPGYDVNGAKAIDVILLVCGNCAAIRTYARKPIVDWAAENPTH
jgi:hypothetical protein